MTAKRQLGAEPSEPTTADGTPIGPPVVGLGASAGGLAAFEAFFSGLPDEARAGMAFVLIQHLDPNHESLLPQLIQQHTRLVVLEAEDGVRVEPNHAYVVPPGRDIVLREGRLWLQSPAEQRGRRPAIDVFFRSLAIEQADRAVGVVLSGTGTDGTEGVHALKERGGRVLVQDPDSAEYEGMPESAIATGLVDAVLPPEDMAAWLLGEQGSEPPVRLGAPAPRTAAEEEGLRELFDILRGRTGHDFSQYKETSILRRLERRMANHRIGTLTDYVRYLRANPEEVETLCGDLLIGVTRFFRDPQAFVALQEEGLPRLLDGLSPGSTFRVWVPACSTGEEAYSVAILVREHLDASRWFPRVQIFATDMDPKAIEVARAGLYPIGIADDMTPERLQRFFTLEEDGTGYRIHKNIRDLLVFSEHDLLSDPPFSHIDLISCRNLLIYLAPESQKKLIHLFHYALNPGGMLLLGTSETVGDAADRFDSVDRSAKLYVKKDAPAGSPRAIHFTRRPEDLRVGVGRRARRQPPARREHPLRELTERELLTHDVPAAVLVDVAGEILYLHGRTGNYLEPAAGEVGMNILSMAREGLKRALASALHQAAATEEQVDRPALRVRTNGDFVMVNLSVRPVSASEVDEPRGGLFLVTLEALQRTARPDVSPRRCGLGGKPTAGDGWRGHDAHRLPGEGSPGL